MHVLVTGGCGFIGSYLARDLIRRGNEVTIVDTRDGDLTADIVGTDLGQDAIPPVYVVDVNDFAAMTRISKARSIDAIVHLAGLLTGPCAAGPSNGAVVNVVGTSSVFQLASAMDISNLVWSSSISVYGHEASDRRLADDAPHSPDNFYALYHSMNEQQARLFESTFGQPSTGLRVAFGYGYGRARGRGSWVSELLTKPARGESAYVLGGDAVVPWIYVDDLASAFSAALTSPSGSCRIYNMRGEPRWKHEAVDFIRTLVPDVELVLGGDVQSYPTGMDDSALRRDLGWAPAFSMEAGILDTINRYRTAAGRPALPMPDLARG